MRLNVVGVAALLCGTLACSGSSPSSTGGSGGSGGIAGSGGSGDGGTGGSGEVTACTSPAADIPAFFLSKATNPIVDQVLTGNVTTNGKNGTGQHTELPFLLSLQASGTVHQFFYRVPQDYRVPDSVMLGDPVVLHFHRDRPGATNLDEWADLHTADGHLIWAAAGLKAGNSAPAGFPDLVVAPPVAGATPICLDPKPPCGARARFAPLADMAIGALPITPGNPSNLVGPRDSGNLLVTEFMEQTDATGCPEATPAVGWVFLGTRNGDEAAEPPCGGTTQCTTGEYCDDPHNTCALEEQDGVCRRYFDSDVTSPQACGCDGTVYDNARLAAKAGFDLQDATKCPVPGGTFACAAYYCPTAKVCVGGPNICDPPNGCEGKTPSCDCLTAAKDTGCTCAGDATAGLTVTCK